MAAMRIIIIVERRVAPRREIRWKRGGTARIESNPGIAAIAVVITRYPSNPNVMISVFAALMMMMMMMMMTGMVTIVIHLPHPRRSRQRRY